MIGSRFNRILHIRKQGVILLVLQIRVGFGLNAVQNQVRDYCKIRSDEDVTEIGYQLMIQHMTNREMGSLSKPCSQIPNFNKEFE